MPQEVLIQFKDGSMALHYIPISLMRGEKENTYEATIIEDQHDNKLCFFIEIDDQQRTTAQITTVDGHSGVQVEDLLYKGPGAVEEPWFDPWTNDENPLAAKKQTVKLLPKPKKEPKKEPKPKKPKNKPKKKP